MCVYNKKEITTRVFEICSGNEMTRPGHPRWRHNPLLQISLIIVFLIVEKKLDEWDFRPSLYTYSLNWARRTSWAWWDKWDDTAFHWHDSKIRALAVWGRVSYLSVTVTPNNIKSLRMSGEFCFFETWRSECVCGGGGGGVSNPRSPPFQAGSSNHCTRPIIVEKTI